MLCHRNPTSYRLACLQGVHVLYGLWRYLHNPPFDQCEFKPHFIHGFCLIDCYDYPQVFNIWKIQFTQVYVLLSGLLPLFCELSVGATHNLHREIYRVSMPISRLVCLSKRNLQQQRSKINKHAIFWTGYILILI